MDASLKQYWQDQHKNKDTPWHQVSVERALTENFAALPKGRVFVPLAGKSLAMLHLASLGHSVVGVELSEQACTEFFDDRHVPFTTSTHGPFKRFQAENDPGIVLLNGDIFDTTAELLGPITAVYDCGSYVALPKDVRVQYAAMITALLGAQRTAPAVHYVLVAAEKPAGDDSGPPYSITAEELNSTFGSAFVVEPTARRAHHRLEDTFEVVYQLKRKEHCNL